MRCDSLAYSSFQMITFRNLCWQCGHGNRLIKVKQLLLLELSCLEGFQTLTSVHLKWPFTYLKSVRDHLHAMDYKHIKFEQPFVEMYKVFKLWLLLTTRDLHLHHTILVQCMLHWDWSKLPFLRYHVYKVFTFCPLFVDLHQKQYFSYTQCDTPYTKNVQAPVLIYGFYNICTIWPCLPPMTSVYIVIAVRCSWGVCASLTQWLGWHESSPVLH